MIKGLTTDKLKNMNIDELNILCREIRDFLIENVSKTGGHLAPNLGVVELTVAIHKVFDLPQDKLVFDVGHQSYVHKILSGRADKMDTLRQFGGISGFPKRSESEFDAFDTGHSSTSVSAALGMARARDLAGKKNNIIALFGDGALTGGEIYEAMNDAGHTKTPLTLILNDNAMSISKNVGAVSKHLRKIRINRVYFNSKRKVSGFLNKIPLIGKPIRICIEKVKSVIRRYVIATTVFEDLGFKYIGPVDGHDLKSLIDCLEYAKTEAKPVLLHVCTQKGKGYTPAEKDPSTFHGVGVFNASDGKLPPLKNSYSSQFGKTLIDIARDNDKVVAITCAMPDGTGLVEFSKLYRDRFFDVGIAEQHGVTFAAGMAASGFIPVIPLYSTFLQRAYDQALHDVCLQNLHVVFPIDRAGIVGADGETHQGVYDLSYLSTMPNMTVLSASSFAQLDSMLRYAINVHNGPIAIRYPRGNTESSFDTSDFEYGKAYVRNASSDVSIIASGRMLKRAEEISETLAKENFTAEIIELPTVFPVNEKAVTETAQKTKFVITLEDNIKSGGMGEHIAEILLSQGIVCKFKAFAFPCEPIVHGTVGELDEKYGVDTVTVSEYIIKELKNGKNQT
ncbi:MAG: 1-deoxy-D-xylulose-5-phosphate synthase [Clostridia bacterium]|nr:1-deoxy-D-xylulose-5-phosphate synthase [Clostridia bacterium]